MLTLFRNYMIIVYVAAIAITMAVSNIWFIATGTVMSASLPGLAATMGILVVSTFLMSAIMSRAANRKAEHLVSLYNDDCDPQAFTAGAKTVADRISAPYDPTTSWFMSYYGQARLDEGEGDEARRIMEGILKSAEASSKPEEADVMYAHAVPLVDKIEGNAAAESLINRVMDRIRQEGFSSVDPVVAYLSNQQQLMTDREDGNDSALIALYGKLAAADDIPMRMRVEYAWDEARVRHRHGDVVGERQCLGFVAKHGNTLALASLARQRLSAMGS